MSDTDRLVELDDEADKLLSRAVRAEAEVERLRSLLANSEMTVAEVMADNERLLAAMREIADHRAAQVSAIGRMARAALEGK